MIAKHALSITIGLILLITSQNLYSQDWSEILNAGGSDAATQDQFGFSVSMSGDLAIVGAPSSDNGAAYMFELIDGQWVETQKITDSDAQSLNQFGLSVSISDDKAIVGAGGNTHAGEFTGAAYIFEQIDGVWIETQKLTASDAEEGDLFGGDVSIFGNYAIVGAYLDNDAGEHSGSAYIFEQTDGVWIETQKLTASDAAVKDRFGLAVSIYENRAIVGAELTDAAGVNSGSAYIYELSDGLWGETQKLSPSDAEGYARFGFSVFISDNSAIVGARRDSDPGNATGSAYIFNYNGTEWIEIQRLTASDASSLDFFGYSVSIDGDLAVVGAPSNDDDGENSGSAYIFELEGTVWTEIQKITASDALSEDHFGRTVSISGDNVIIGGPTNSFSDGSAYFYGSSPAGILENSFENEIAVFPNPTDGNFSIDLGKNYNSILVNMTDLTGKYIRSEVYSNTQLMNFNIEESKGVYFLEIESQDNKAVIRVVKE